MKQGIYIFTAINMIACMGPDQETLVDELRVMAIQAEPAEVQLRDFIPNESGETSKSGTQCGHRRSVGDRVSVGCLTPYQLW